MAGRKQATMANTAAVTLLLVAALLAMVAVAPATETGYTMCNVNLVKMKGACEKYCARGSREASPGRKCCDTLRGADFQCLCGLKGVIESMGNIDARRAMEIPSKCRIPRAPTSC